MFSERDYNRQGPYRQPGPRSYWRDHSIVFHLIVINAVVYMLDTLFNHGLVAHFCLIGGRHSLMLGQFWRYVTYQFLHADFFHVLFNLWALKVFGGMVEERLGRSRFLTMYLFSGVLAGLFWMMANATGYPSVLVGASGAIFGVMVAGAMAFPNARFMLVFPPIAMRLWTLTIVYCAIEILSALSDSRGNIAHLAHIGGALGGFLFMRRLGFRMPSSDADGGYRRRYSPPEQNTPPPTGDAEGYASRRTPFSSEKPFVFSSSELDRILDKMSRQGEAHLTPEERAYLHRASEELKKKN